jgi:predicted DNA binding CopG/RHH family protein
MKTLLIILAGLGIVFSSLAGQTSDIDGVQPPFFTRAFVVNTSFLTNLHQHLPPKAGESNQELLLRYLKTQQIEIKKPVTLVLEEKHRRLTVRTSEIDLEKIQALISSLQSKN